MAPLSKINHKWPLFQKSVLNVAFKIKQSDTTQAELLAGSVACHVLNVSIREALSHGCLGKQAIGL